MHCLSGNKKEVIIMTIPLVYSPNDTGWFFEDEEPTGLKISNTNPICKLSVWAKLAIGVGTCTLTGMDADFCQRFIEDVQDSAYHIAMPMERGQQAMIQIITPQLKVEQIIATFSPAISDIAMAFGVSRQTIYNWINGNAIDVIHMKKLDDFAEAANIAASSEVPITGWLLKRKIADGKNLMEIVQDNGSAKEAVSLLLQILNKESEQRNRLSARLAGRRRTFRSPESDFQEPNDSMG